MDKRAVITICVPGESDRVYRFELPVGAPFGEAYDAAFKVLKEILAMSNQALEAARPQESSDEEIGESAMKEERNARS